MNRKLAFIWIIILTAQPYAYTRQVRAGEGEAVRIERLAALCKLWGAARYFHPYLAYKDIDWDRALVETIPRVRAATSADQFQAAIDHLLSFLNDPSSRTYTGPDTAAVGPRPAPGAGQPDAGGPQPSIRWTGDIAVITATDYDRFIADPQTPAVLDKVLTEARKARAVVFDIRRIDAGRNVTADGWFTTAFSQAVGLLLGEDVPLPSTRHRMHSGYASEGSSGGYYSAFVVNDGGAIRARGPKGGRRQMAFVTNAGTAGRTVLSALQSAGLATVVLEGEAGAEAGGQVYRMSLPGGVTAAIRTSEVVNPDGTLGFRPDVTLPPTARGAADSPAAIETALKMVREDAGSRPSVRKAAASMALTMVEKPYAEMEYPTAEYRLLGLFRLWNVIHYFFPYKHLTDRPWDEVLTEYIPKVEAAKDALEYTLAVMGVVRSMNDSHGVIGNKAWNQYMGIHIPPIEVRSVQGQTVITHMFDESVKQSSGLNIGDIVLSVDGEEIGKRRERLGGLFAASTPQALRRRVDLGLLCGAENTEIRLEVKQGTGKVSQVTLKRSMMMRGSRRQGPVVTVLPEGYGYIDLARLTVPEVDAAFETIKGTPAVIFDMRGYPRATIWDIAPRLASREVVTSRYSRPELHSPDPTENSQRTGITTAAPGPKWRYTGKVVVLINEDAVSQSEHTCLFMEATSDATFVGSPTNGTNGDVTTLILPGNLHVRFTGHDIRHADGRQLQRIGIQPHVKVEPTIEGIRNGKDEVLEKAIDFLKKGGNR